MKTLLKALWFISGIGFLAMGCYCLFNVRLTLLSLAWLIGVSVLFHGVTAVITFFCIKNTLGFTWRLLDGILSLIFGVLLLCNESIIFIAGVLPWLFTIWLLIRGIIQIIFAMEYKKATGHSNGTKMLMSVLSLLLGVLMLFTPYLAAFIISFTVGIYLIVIGVVFITSFFRYRELENF